jgi:hypothetical protein
MRRLPCGIVKAASDAIGGGCDTAKQMLQDIFVSIGPKTWPRAAQGGDCMGE